MLLGKRPRWRPTTDVLCDETSADGGRTPTDVDVFSDSVRPSAEALDRHFYFHLNLLLIEGLLRDLPSLRT